MTKTRPTRLSRFSQIAVWLITICVAVPAGATEPAPDAPLAEQKPAKPRTNTFGFGPGFVVWPPPKDQPAAKTDVVPAVSVQTRTGGTFAGSVVGFEWTNDIVFHDWQAMADAYDWYFGPAETEDEKDAKAIRLGVGWPGLIFIPFGAANYQTGIGLVVWTSRSQPAVWFDLGGQMALYLRLSDPKFRADFALGLYAGAGFDILKNVGVSARVMWGSPFIHTLIKQSRGGITTAVFNINFLH